MRTQSEVTESSRTLRLERSDLMGYSQIDKLVVIIKSNSHSLIVVDLWAASLMKLALRCSVAAQIVT